MPFKKNVTGKSRARTFFRAGDSGGPEGQKEKRETKEKERVSKQKQFQLTFSSQ